MSPAQFLVFIGILLVLAGCGPSAATQTINALNSAADVADKAQALLAVEYEREQLAAVDTATTKAEATAEVYKIRQRYAPAWTSHRVFRIVWIDIATAVQIAQASREPIDGVKLFKLLAKLADAQRSFIESVKKIE